MSEAAGVTGESPWGVTSADRAAVRRARASGGAGAEVSLPEAEVRRILTDEAALARAWKVINDPKADPVGVRDALDALPAADAARVGEQVMEGLLRRAGRTGSYDEVDRIAPYLPSETAGERRALEGAAVAVTAGVPPEVPPVGASAPGTPRLSPDARVVHEALGTVLDARASAGEAEGLKQYAAEALARREMVLGVIDLPPDARALAGRTPVHTADEMREVLAVVRERPAVPGETLQPAAAAEVRRSIVEQAEAQPTLRDLTRLYGQADMGASIAAVSADPGEGRALRDALDAVERRLLSQEVRRQAPDQAQAQTQAQMQTGPAARDGAPVGHRAGAEAPAPDGDGGVVLTLKRKGGAGTAADIDGDGRPTSPPSDPPGVRRGYAVETREDGARDYYRRSDGALAFTAAAETISGALRDRDTVGAMLDVAQARGWSDVRVAGDREVARTAWVEATARGLTVDGYRPTRDDRHDAEQRRAELGHAPIRTRADGFEERPDRVRREAPRPRHDLPPHPSL